MQVCGWFLMNKVIFIQQVYQERRPLKRFTATGVTTAIPCITLAIIHIGLYFCVLFFLVNSNNAEVNGTYHWHKECIFLDFTSGSILMLLHKIAVRF